MDNMVKKLVISLILCISLLLSACTGWSANARMEIGEKAKEAMEYFYDKDTEKLIELFCKDIRENKREETLAEINALYDFLDGDIESYEYEGEGSYEKKKSDGVVYYYKSRHEFIVVTENGTEYDLEVGINYIWNDKPEYENIYAIYLFERDNTENNMIAGHIYHLER